MKIVIPMLGADEEFGRWGKFLQASNGVSLVSLVIKNLMSWIEGDFIFVISEADKRRHLDNVLKLFCPGCEIVVSRGETRGALCSVLLAVEHFGKTEKEDLLIANGDQIVNFDGRVWIDDLREKNYDAGIVVFNSVHPRWSSVRLDENGHVIEASEKNPISTFATAGFYWFRNANGFFHKAARTIRSGEDTEGSFYVCPVLNEYVLARHVIGAFEIEPEQYISLSTSKDFESYCRDSK